jgi:RNA polymerase sigma-70 factor (ECF subfamily)
MEKTDLQLIEDSIYRTQGRSSFNILIERHAKSVYLFIFKLVGNKEDSEDIVQETFIKAWQKLSKFDTEKNFKTWLFSIAKNTAVDKLRKKKSINFSSLNIEEESDFEANLIDQEDLPDELFEKKESEENLKSALLKLSENQRFIIYLHINEELTFEEIAEIINKPMNTVKSQYRRAISKLKNILI